jgi:hypothetical protein
MRDLQCGIEDCFFFVWLFAHFFFWFHLSNSAKSDEQKDQSTLTSLKKKCGFLPKAATPPPAVFSHQNRQVLPLDRAR